MINYLVEIKTLIFFSKFKQIKIIKKNIIYINICNIYFNNKMSVNTKETALEKAETYLRKHRITDLFEDLANKLCFK